MRAYIIFFIFVVMLSFVCVGFAEDAVSLPPQESASAADTNEAAPTSFPYVAEITGDDVYIRSGPGTQYYRCGKLNKDDTVKVVDSKLGWSRIIPPPGSFSWIAKQYIVIDAETPKIGIVTGNAVIIYVGSEHYKPIHSTSNWVKLNKGEKVEIIDEQGVYYKINPPAGAYRWVSTEYTKPLGAAEQITTEAKPTQAVEPEEKAPTVVPTKLPVEDEKLNEYYALEKQLIAERAKPESEQNYTQIKKALLEISACKEAAKASRYAEFTLKQIDRFELALEVDKALKLQDQQLKQNKERIDKALAVKLTQIQPLGIFAATGRLQTSKIYGPEAQLKYYRIVDESDKTTCYTLPTGKAANLDMDKFVGLKVGLVGTIEPHLQTSSALVRFTEIVQLK